VPARQVLYHLSHALQPHFGGFKFTTINNPIREDGPEAWSLGGVLAE
jgi:hypothetical protein